MTDDPKMSEEVLRLLRARHETRSSQLPDSPEAHEITMLGAQLTRDLIGIERKCIHTLLRNGRITDEARRRIERDLDLEEAGIANREYRKIPL
jgi:CPA1 family monovalent cation:H+ antiporter